MKQIWKICNYHSCLITGATMNKRASCATYHLNAGNVATDVFRLVPLAVRNKNVRVCRKRMRGHVGKHGYILQTKGTRCTNYEDLFQTHCARNIIFETSERPGVSGQAPVKQAGTPAHPDRNLNNRIKKYEYG